MLTYDASPARRWERRKRTEVIGAVKDMAVKGGGGGGGVILLVRDMSRVERIFGDRYIPCFELDLVGFVSGWCRPNPGQMYLAIYEHKLHACLSASLHQLLIVMI